jgi:hypothetical protein
MTGIRYYEAPNYYERQAGDPPAVFLAGGITGCPPWHADAVEYLADSGVPMVVLNPARQSFPIHDPDAGWEQVRWEQDHLLADRVITMMWFPKPLKATTVQPIACLEFGQITVSPGRRFAVGTDPEYPRVRDIGYFMRYHRPNQTVHTSLSTLLASTVNLVRALGGEPR